MTGLIFLHGWGYGPKTWDGLAGAFGEAPVVVLDAGYFGERRMELPQNLADTPGGWIGVGHSLGFARLLALDVPWRGLVGVGGFLRFCQKPGQTTGTPTDMLNAMLSRLDTAPEEVLARFHRRCGHRDDSLVQPRAHGPSDGLVRLRADLEGLRDLDVRPDGQAVPTLLLHALDDRIVPLDLAREAQGLLPGSRLELLESGGHALPMTRAQDCLRLVREFRRDLG
jgi:pimeloyl-[acyl-carrier protein] methyl ester esterase